MLHPKIQPPSEPQNQVSESSTRQLTTITALQIVLQKWMVPKLGWNIKVYEDKLPSLCEQIIEFQMSRDIPSQDNNNADNILDELNSNGHNYFDLDYAIELKPSLANFSFDALIQDCRMIEPNVEEYSLNTLKRVVQREYKKYWKPFAIMLEHQLIRMTINFRENYLSLHKTMVWFMNDQQSRWGHRNSLISHQLGMFERCGQLLTMIELSIFHFSMNILHVDYCAEKMLHEVYTYDAEDLESFRADQVVNAVQVFLEFCDAAIETLPTFQSYLNEIYQRMANSIASISNHVASNTNSIIRDDLQPLCRVIHMILHMKSGTNEQATQLLPTFTLKNEEKVNEMIDTLLDGSLSFDSISAVLDLQITSLTLAIMRDLSYCSASKDANIESGNYEDWKMPFQRLMITLKIKLRYLLLQCKSNENSEDIKKGIDHANNVLALGYQSLASYQHDLKLDSAIEGNQAIALRLMRAIQRDVTHVRDSLHGKENFKLKFNANLPQTILTPIQRQLLPYNDQFHEWILELYEQQRMLSDLVKNNCSKVIDLNVFSNCFQNIVLYFPYCDGLTSRSLFNHPREQYEYWLSSVMIRSINEIIAVISSSFLFTEKIEKVEYASMIANEVWGIFKHMQEMVHDNSVTDQNEIVQVCALVISTSIDSQIARWFFAYSTPTKDDVKCSFNKTLTDYKLWLHLRNLRLLNQVECGTIDYRLICLEQRTVNLLILATSLEERVQQTKRAWHWADLPSDITRYILSHLSRYEANKPTTFLQGFRSILAMIRGDETVATHVSTAAQQLVIDFIDTFERFIFWIERVLETTFLMVEAVGTSSLTNSLFADVFPMSSNEFVNIFSTLEWILLNGWKVVELHKSFDGLWMVIDQSADEFQEASLALVEFNESLSTMGISSHDDMKALEDIKMVIYTFQNRINEFKFKALGKEMKHKDPNHALDGYTYSSLFF